MLGFRGKNKRAKYVSLLLGAILAVSLLCLALPKLTPSSETKVSRIVSSDAFLAGLQNKAPDGCVALMHMESVDIVLLGSSSAYAYIDAYVLSQAFDGLSVGVCALPAWNADFFEYFFAYLDDHDIRPERIIWLTDQYTHLQLDNYDKRKAYARSVFSDPVLQEKEVQEWEDTFGAETFSYAQAMSDYRERISRHMRDIEALSLPVVEKVIKRTDFASKAALKTILETARPNPDNAAKLRRICAYTEQNSIRLDMVLAPVPKDTELLFNQARERSAAASPANTAMRSDTSISCAQSQIAAPLEDWGLDSRYFVNRMLKPNYPYDIWRDPDTFEEKYDAMDTRLRSLIYDESHINGVGAAIFTQKLADAIL